MNTSIQISGYRRFAAYEIDGLNRVNLLVGANSSGKTSALEAIRLASSQRPLQTAIDISYSRGETGLVSDGDGDRTRYAPNIRHFFCGHGFEPHSSISISADRSQLKFSIDELSVDDLTAPVRRSETLGFNDSVLALTIQSGSGETAHKEAIEVLPNGTLLFDRRRTSTSALAIRNTTSPACTYIGPDSLSHTQLADAWHHVSENRREEEIASHLRLIMENVEDVRFLPNQRVAGYSAASANGSVLVGLADQRQRVPIGSLGEGMNRLLALFLALEGASGGTILVDEIDTGLHWSIMRDLWSAVALAAAARNVQVFATTHSYDCIRGLAELYLDNPATASKVTVFRIDPDIEFAIGYEADGVEDAIRADIEVRGYAKS